jgi:hypothetical protein
MTKGTKLLLAIAIATIGPISMLGSADAYVANRDAGASVLAAWDASSVVRAWDASSVVQAWDAAAALGYDAGAAPMRASGTRDAGSATPR